MCDQCEALMINGVLCHEHGCPAAWKDYDRVCRWCGQVFRPEDNKQECCSDSCRAAYYGDILWP